MNLSDMASDYRLDTINAYYSASYSLCALLLASQRRPGLQLVYEVGTDYHHIQCSASWSFSELSTITSAMLGVVALLYS